MVNDIVQMISTVGFPIAACVALFWQNNKWEERHEEESKTFVSAINNNTTAIERLTCMIQDKENE